MPNSVQYLIIVEAIEGVTVLFLLVADVIDSCKLCISLVKRSISLFVDIELIGKRDTLLSNISIGVMLLKNDNC